MLATVFNLPKWLLAAVVFCIVIGHFQQIECKLAGCPSEAVDAGTKTPAKADPASQNGGDHPCACQCHFTVSTPFVGSPAFVPLHLAPTMQLGERAVRAPEAPCAEIEYPPRSFRA